MDRSESRFFPEIYVQTTRSAVAYLGGVLKRQIIPVLLITLLGAAAGFAWWYTRPAVYESYLVCSYNHEHLPRKAFGEMTHKLDLLARSGSGNELARQTGLTPAQAGSILSIEAKNRAGSALHEDITPEYQPVYIHARATDNRVFPPLQEGLMRYLGTSPYVKSMADILIAKLEQKKGFLLADMRKTDSIIDAYTVAVRAGSVFRDTVNGNSDLTDILRYKDELEEKLANADFKIALESGSSVTVMHGFVPPDRPTRGSKKIIAGAALLGFLAAFCLALLRDKNQPPAHA